MWMKLLRPAFLLLILANLLFYIWAQGYLGPRDDGREPLRLVQQLVPEKLRLVAAEKPVAQNPPQPVAVLPEACRVISGLDLVEATRIEKAETEKVESKGLNFVVKPGESAQSYWVHIPSLGSAQAAEKKADELRRRGLVDFSIMPEGSPSKFAISLGLFKNAELANGYLQSLAKRGVKSAKIQAREEPSAQAQLEVRGPVDLLSKRLPELVAGNTAVSLNNCLEVPKGTGP